MRCSPLISMLPFLLDLHPFMHRNRAALHRPAP
jgi:hypothetical protein